MNTYELFLNYALIPTMSDEESETIPSTKKQLVLAALLKDQLLELGLSDARVDEHGYVYGAIPANCDGMPSIGFIAHMDTASDAPGENIKAKMINYEGGDILLNEEQGIVLSMKDYPYVGDLAGQRLIVTDGTTLLGADDKAGIAEIVSAMAWLKEHPEVKHGRIRVGFNPDEEIGKGAHKFDVEAFGAEWAYTLDGGEIGVVVEQVERLGYVAIFERCATERDGLVEHRQSVTHTAIGLLSDEVERLLVGRNALVGGDVAQILDSVLDTDTVEIIDLATRKDCRDNLVLLSCCKDEDCVLWWLLQGLEEGVERRRREHMNLIDDEDRVATHLRDDAHLLNKVADIIHRVVRRSIELVDVE